jgi:hypothetical protein
MQFILLLNQLLQSYTAVSYHQSSTIERYDAPGGDVKIQSEVLGGAGTDVGAAGSGPVGGGGDALLDA